MITRTALEDAAAFWEAGRLAYNGVLAAAVFAYASMFNAWMQIGAQFGAIVVMGAVANVLYCAAYPVDLVAQATPLAGAWRRWRWVAWMCGMLLALPLALLGMTAVAAPSSGGL